MIEKACSFWLEQAECRCILTSGAVTPDGQAVLESRSALEAAKRYSGLAADLGRLLTSRGNHVHEIRPGLLSFPVKQYQLSGPTLALITRSAAELAELAGTRKTLLPRPGCGPNELLWDAVKAALANLPDNFIVVAEA